MVGDKRQVGNDDSDARREDASRVLHEIAAVNGSPNMYTIVTTTDMASTTVQRRRGATYVQMKSVEGHYM